MPMKTAILWNPGGKIVNDTVTATVRTDGAVLIQAEIVNGDTPTGGGPLGWLAALPDEIVVDESLRIDVAARRVFLNDAEVQMSGVNFELLCALARQPDRCWTKPELYRDVWNHGSYVLQKHADRPVTRTLDSHASRLRKLLGGGYVENVWGQGYRLRRTKATRGAA